jgi:DNA-binding NtrC family response regulator
MPPLHLLVVGGDTPTRERVLVALHSQGHRVLAVADGPAGAEALGSPGFDFLVLDLALADVSLATLRDALAPAQPAEPDSLEAAQGRHIALALRYTGGNRRRAAQLLGISRSTLLHKLRKYGLE